MNIFKSYLAFMSFFHLIFPWRIFVLYFTVPPPTPDKFFNGPSLNRPFLGATFGYMI